MSEAKTNALLQLVPAALDIADRLIAMRAAQAATGQLDPAFVTLQEQYADHKLAIAEGLDKLRANP